MFKTTEDGRTLEGNDKFEGFCIDLLHQLSLKLGFDYRIKLVEDGNYGGQKEDGSFDWMVAELMERVRMFHPVCNKLNS